MLAGLHSGGLLLMQRDSAAERERQAAARQRWEVVQELGGGGEGTDQAPAPRLAGARFVPTLREAVQLDVVASSRDSLVGGVAAICPGLLGVPVRQLGQLSISGGSGACAVPFAAGAAAGEEGAIVGATVVCTNGTVASARLLTPDQHGTLWQLQKAAELTADGPAGGWGSSLAVPPPHGAAAPAAAAGGPGGCVDGTLAAAYLHPGWHQRLLKAAAPEAVQRGRSILEACGLL